jgi:hypothetical protein
LLTAFKTSKQVRVHYQQIGTKSGRISATPLIEHPEGWRRRARDGDGYGQKDSRVPARRCGLPGALRCGRRLEEASSAARGTGAGRLDDDGGEAVSDACAGRASLWADDAT